jgi:hypothetical protein
VPREELEKAKEQILAYKKLYPTGFSAEDIVDELNLDPVVVIEAVSILKSEGKIKEIRRFTI